MNIFNLISKDEFLTQLKKNIQPTGIWIETSTESDHIKDLELDNEYFHLTVNQNQLDLCTIHDIRIDSFCKANNVDFVSFKQNSEIEFIHISRKRNFESILNKGLINDKENSFIPDLGSGIYAVDANSEIGIDNLKTFLEDFNEPEVLLIKAYYKGEYSYCIHGEGHVGYLVLHEDTIPPSSLTFEIIKLETFLLEY